MFEGIVFVLIGFCYAYRIELFNLLCRLGSSVCSNRAAVEKLIRISPSLLLLLFGGRSAMIAIDAADYDLRAYARIAEAAAIQHTTTAALYGIMAIGSFALAWFFYQRQEQAWARLEG